jgi:hypothetical protein
MVLIMVRAKAGSALAGFEQAGGAVGKRPFASAGSYRTATRMGWTASLPGRLLSTSDWQAGRQSESACTCARTNPLPDRDKRVSYISQPGVTTDLILKAARSIS